MKISKKLLGIGVASIGALASIGGAFALYSTAAEDVEFGISAGAYAGSGGTVTYKINDAGGASQINPSYLKEDGTNGGTGLSSVYTQVKYEMALSAVYAAGANAQNYVVGNLSVSLTNIPEAYRGKLSIWVGIDDYVSGSLGANTYGHIFMASDYAITNENQQFVGAHDVTVSANGTQKLVIYLKYNLAGIDLLEKDEASLGYSLAVSWGEPSNEFVPAYVKGDAIQWSEDEGYAMLPNINKTTEGWEWIYNNLPGTIGNTKCYINNGSEKWSQSDYTCDPAKSYNVTWSGENGAAANYEEIA